MQDGLTNEEIQFVTDVTGIVGEAFANNIVGQAELVESILISLFADGHLLLESVPGLGKTRAVRVLADSLSANFARIQFTPDLLPSDIVGTQIYNQSKAEFTTELGPVFANIVLADEINRAPAKVQSALLECMQERQISIGGKTFDMPKPFLVMATQNPIEQEGTYILPEAQIDRFIMKHVIDYPSPEDEQLLLDRVSETDAIIIKNKQVPENIIRAQQLVRKVYVDPKIKNYITRIVYATRKPSMYKIPNLDNSILLGSSPRGSIGLLYTARAKAILAGRNFVKPEDIKSVAHRVLRHRINLSYEAEAQSVTPDQIIDTILANMPAP